MHIQIDIKLSTIHPSVVLSHLPGLISLTLVYTGAGELMHIQIDIKLSTIHPSVVLLHLSGLISLTLIMDSYISWSWRTVMYILLTDHNQQFCTSLVPWPLVAWVRSGPRRANRELGMNKHRSKWPGQKSQFGCERNQNNFALFGPPSSI